METLIKIGGFYTIALVAFHFMFWLERAVQQIVFFKLRHWASWAILLLFISTSLLYAVPAIHVVLHAV